MPSTPEYHKAWRERNKEKIAARKKEWRKNNAEKVNETYKEWYKKQKIEILTHYSNGIPQCTCCGENEISFLVLDHINNDGNECRRDRKKGGSDFYLNLKRNNYPSEPQLQVLCSNCNQGKALNGGICPHQIKRTTNEDHSAISRPNTL